jgi:hypothetical protein
MLDRRLLSDARFASPAPIRGGAGALAVPPKLSRPVSATLVIASPRLRSPAGARTCFPMARRLPPHARSVLLTARQAGSRLGHSRSALARDDAAPAISASVERFRVRKSGAGVVAAGGTVLPGATKPPLVTTRAGSRSQSACAGVASEDALVLVAADLGGRGGMRIAEVHPAVVDDSVGPYGVVAFM